MPVCVRPTKANTLAPPDPIPPGRAEAGVGPRGGSLLQTENLTPFRRCFLQLDGRAEECGFQ